MRASRSSRWLPLVIAARYARGRRSRLLHRTAAAALVSVALGVLAMVIAMALMTGYRRDLEEKLVRGNAAILVYPLAPGQSSEDDPTSGLMEVPGISAVRPVAYGQSTVLSARRSRGEAVTLRGVAAGPDPMSGGPAPGPAGEDGVLPIVLGVDLAGHLEVVGGDLVRVVVLGWRNGRPRFTYRSARVESTFRSGFAEFDRHWALVELGTVESVTGGSASQLWEIEVDDPGAAPELADAVRSRLGPDFLVTDWQDLNRELFSALRLQQIALFFLLGLIVLVSTFNVASTLMVLVRERMRDVGVLAALGLDRRRVAATFVAYGGMLGALGTAIGVSLGWTACWVLTRYELVRFDPEVAEIYFISSVPFRVTPSDLAAVVVFALLFTLVSSLVPAWRAARVDPATALRYE